MWPSKLDGHIYTQLNGIGTLGKIALHTVSSTLHQESVIATVGEILTPYIHAKSAEIKQCMGTQYTIQRLFVTVLTIPIDGAVGMEISTYCEH